ncbi:MAG: BlaI/MecI/CopY family transcriptional regulator [Acidobacteriota bacterium]
MTQQRNLHPAGYRSLSRRERQIMDVLYARGRAGAAEVRSEVADPPSYSTVRALLRVLEEKGHVRHELDGQRYVFIPVVDRRRARRSVLRHLVDTFFDGSAEQAVATLLDLTREELTEEDLNRLSRLIDQAKEEGR